MATSSVSQFFSDAAEAGASDVHIAVGSPLFLRVDGVLQEVAGLPHELWKKIVARVKLISRLKINVTDRPQDGRFTIFLKSGDTDVRVSAIPTTWGESIVLRVLKPGSINVEFSGLGFRPLAEKKLLKEMMRIVIKHLKIQKEILILVVKII